MLTSAGMLAMENEYTGGIRSNLDILSQRRPAASGSLATTARKDDLYLHGYGRQWGEKLTYSVGLAYASGLAVGGGYGLVMGLRKGGATSRLFFNSVLNSTSTHGPALANQCAVIAGFYVGFNNLIGWVRGADDIGNAAIAGALAGGLFKITTSWKAAIRYSLVATGVFTGIDYVFKQM
ncbi:unnamed protein product [Vitrella brassicaformis CCMP3155]|uniref:Mitochondrial import inner membrane translocase subunit TIM23 n=2 Tax=Vitrella brassicaformis TaxID=1169539 RepID=A0A0G4EAP1_VITBC|nr:unnamed protein product [Vitrella brassicaformis CCMP3155]|eukprot:CEL92352.1 unnamed protein product [Vitrella brassicaformis CCMP3155]